MTQPLVSIVVPVYNVEKYLEKCIQSICKQTYTHLQIIIVDDGSTDSSGALCENYAKQDSRILVIHTENHGLSCARNEGMKYVKGDYLVYVDSDDYVGANHIQNFLDVLEQYPETDLVITGRRKFFEGEQIEEKVFKPKMRLMPGEEAIRISIDAKDQTFSVNAWGKLYRRNLFPCLEFPEGKLYEDNYVYYKAICNAEKIVYEDANDYYYLIDRADSITNTNSLKSLDELRAFDEMLLYVKDRLPDAYDPVFATFAGKHVAGYEIARSLNEKVIANDLYRRMLSIRSDVLKKSCVPASTRIAFFTTFLGRPMFNLALRLNRVKLLYEKARKEKEALN